MITVGWEPLSRLISDGLEDLAIQHHEEAEEGPVPLALDVPQALAMEKVGIFRIAAVRNDGVLIGYADFMITTPLHNVRTKTAFCQGLFVEPEARGAAGVKLLRFINREMDRLDVKRTFIASKFHVPLGAAKKSATLGRLLGHLGYQPSEVLHVRLKGSGYEQRSKRPDTVSTDRPGRR